MVDGGLGSLPVPAAVVGRDAEWARLAGAVEAAASGAGKTFVVTGASGAGKSLLVQALGDAAAHDGHIMTLRLRAGAEGEGLGSGLLGILRALRPYIDGLASVHRDVVSNLIAGSPGNAYAIGSAVVELLAVASAEQPVLVTVDEADALEPLTMDVLLFMAGHLEGHAVSAVLVAAEPLSPKLAQLPQVLLGPLDAVASAVLLRRSMPRLMTAAVERQLLELADGNATALTELPALLTADEAAGRIPLHDHVAMNARLQEVFTRGVGDLRPAAARALLVCAASFERTLAPILEACRVLDIDREALDEAQRNRLVSVSAGRVRFWHPLSPSAVHSAASPADLRAIHSALAGAYPDASEQRARHLAAATQGYDETVAVILQSAADAANARGDVGAATSLLAQAAERSADANDRVGRRVAAAECAIPAGRGPHAEWLLARVLDEVSDPGDRARAHRLRARMALLGSVPFPQAVTVLETQAAALAESEPQLALALRVDANLLTAVSRGLGNGTLLDELEATRAMAAASGAAGMRHWAELAVATALAGNHGAAEARQLLDGAQRLVVQPSSTVEAVQAGVHSAVVLLLTGDEQACRETLEPLIARGRATGAAGVVPLPLAAVGQAAFLQGDWATAHAAGEEASEVAALTGQATAGAYAAMTQALVAAGRGREERCRQTARAALATATMMGLPGVAAALHWGLGLLDLGAGRPEAAAAHLRTAGAVCRRGPAPAAPGIVRWRADLSEALADLGRDAEARQQADELQQESERFGSAYGLAAAARCRIALAEEAELDQVAAQARVLLDSAPNPFEHARLHLSWGARLLRAGRHVDARHPLAEAMTAFEHLDALPWAARSRRALEHAGGIPRVPSDDGVAKLSERQLQVARAAARGASERDIADLLFTTAATVRRDLDVVLETFAAATRTELAAALARAGIVERRTLPRPVVASVRVLGRFEVRVGEEVVDGLAGVPARTVQAVAAHGGRIDMERLVELLWPEQREGVGRTRLRNILWRVQEVAGPLLVRDGGAVRFADSVDVDVVRFEAAADAAVAGLARQSPDAQELAARAADLYGGLLLSGEADEEWMTAPRERLRRRFLALIDVLVDDATQRGDVTAALRLLERGIEADPGDETRYEAAARLLMTQGRTRAARDYVKRAEDAAAQLGLRPSARLRALAEELDRG